MENAVGAHLLNGLSPSDHTVTYWRNGNLEVDFVVTAGNIDWAFEVKSGRAGKMSGAQAFRRQYPDSRILLVGGGGIPLEDFFGAQAGDWLR